ncbi:hypothetical protein ACA910_010453 [Epithemia clementina (nom. ined.)]
MDETPLLDENGICLYQTLIGMAHWACTTGRLGISFAVSSLSCFLTAPREGHLELAVYLFGYLKKHPNRQIALGSQPLLIPEEYCQQTFHPNFLEDYPDASEDIDPHLTKTFVADLETSLFFMLTMHMTRRHGVP